ncbi:MAG: hypothetical protein ACK4UN_03770, partial [Limisphaerales bacterium]
PEQHVGDLLDATAARFKSLDESEFRADLEKLSSRAVSKTGDPLIRITSVPSAPGINYSPNEKVTAPVVQQFSGLIENNWRTTSFSALSQGAFSGEEPDFDAEEIPVRDNTVSTGIFAFPSGIRPGICIHQIFERLNFNDDSKIDDLVREKLSENGFDLDHLPVVAQMVRNVIATRLPCGHDLRSIKHQDRLNELEFSFPLNEITSGAIHGLFTRHNIISPSAEAPAQIGRLTFSPVQGFMRGFIDQVFRVDGKFYIVDWKSSWLGNRPEDYDATAMWNEMFARFYHLQYHIYTIALNRYLQNRLADYKYEEHFGGVIYAFVRGIDPARPDLGIFHDRPSPQLISDLDELLVIR